MTERFDASACFDDLKQILVSAAGLARPLFGANLKVISKGDGTPVTQADLAVDRFLRLALPDILPGTGWLSEETVDDLARLDREWVWIVDPLDGTTEFARGVAECAISIGLVRGNTPVLGGIVNPITGEGGVGALDAGTMFWSISQPRTAAHDLSGAIASVSRREVDDGTMAPYRHLVPTTLPVGSVAYKLLRVAAGIDDLTFSVQHKSEWDVCGGVALLQAAGMTYRRFDDVPLDFNRRDTRIRSGTVAGVPLLVNQFMSAFRGCQVAAESR